MLYCPFLSPFNRSKRLEGGTLRSFRIVARLSMRSFLKATCCISFGNFFEKILLNIFSVSLHLNDWIINNILNHVTYNVKRYILFKHNAELTGGFSAITAGNLLVIAGVLPVERLVPEAGANRDVLQ